MEPSDTDVATMAEDAELVTLAPREVMAKVHKLTAELAGLELRIMEKERELQQLQDDRNLIAREHLPMLFDHLHTDRLGVPGQRADVVLAVNIHASIAKDWTEKERAAAFAELERLGGEDLLRCRVSTDFDRSEFELAAEFVRYISSWNRMGGRTVTVDKSVHWKTLTAFVRRLRAKLVPMNIQALGATVVRECKIEWRK